MSEQGGAVSAIRGGKSKRQRERRRWRAREAWAQVDATYAWERGTGRRVPRQDILPSEVGFYERVDGSAL
jgi:hypothetical protein